jgi:hypothetical protein
MTIKYLKKSLFLFLFPVSLFSLEKPNFDFNKWFYTISPFWGEGYNANQIPFRLIEYKNDKPVLHSGSKSFSGSGKGSGVEFMAFNPDWQILYVGFYFPMYPNKDSISLYDYIQNIKTEVTGHVFSLRYKFLKYEKSEIFTGMSYFQGNGPHDYSIVNNFVLYSYSTNQFVQIPQVNVKVYVEDPNPYVGISYKLPIQNWKIDAIYSYGFERVNTDLQTSIARTVDSNNALQNFDSLSILQYNIENSNILPLNYTIRKKYFANRFALSLFMDYRRFVSLRINLRRDLTFNRWVSNAIFNLIFSQYMGLSFFYEYSERSVGTIRYWLIGPTFVFQF